MVWNNTLAIYYTEQPKLVFDSYLSLKHIEGKIKFMLLQRQS